MTRRGEPFFDDQGSTSTLNASRRPSFRWIASVNQSRVRLSTTSNASTPPSQTGVSPTSRISCSATSRAGPSSAA
jgi:hypothetical protein